MARAASLFDDTPPQGARLWGYLKEAALVRMASSLMLNTIAETRTHMGRYFTWIVLFLTATTSGTTPAQADPIRTTVTVGIANSGNLFPFGSGPNIDTEYRGLYQQIYAADAFDTSLRIDEIAFQTTSSSDEPVMASSFSLKLGTTSSSPLNPRQSYAENRGADLSQVFEGTVTVARPGSGTFDFVIPLSRPFFYDNTRGNLLFDVFIIRNTTTQSFVAGTSEATGRIFNLGGTGVTTPQGRYGLLTQFSGTLENTVPVPEPSTLVLLGASGTALLCRAARRRRANATDLAAG